MSDPEPPMGPGARAALIRGIAGGLVGAALGHAAFMWCVRQGVVPLALPGVATGIGASGAARRSSIPLAVAAGAIGLGVSIYSEWRIAPFRADRSLAYFVLHLHLLKPFTWVMIAAGTAVAVWFSYPRRGGPAA